MTFKKRVDAFWNWFVENESKLADMVDNQKKYGSDAIVEFISEGTGLVSDDIHFNMGGDYEFTFAAEGATHRFFLNPYLVSRMPEQLKGKWKVFPYMPGTKGKGFGFGMHGKKVNVDDVMVSMQYEKEADLFNLWYHNPVLAELEENEALNTFYIMMEICIGDALARIYVDDVQRSEAAEDAMFPLTELEQRMTTAIEEAGNKVATRLEERFTGYQLKPGENKELRYDIMIGTTSYINIVNDYYADETDELDRLAAYGAKPVFLTFAYTQTEDRNALLETRYELQDRLQNEVLGRQGYGEEAGIVVGGAMGTSCVYIDILLYDEDEFMQSVRRVLDEYPHRFYLSDFKQHSKLVALFED